MITENSIIQKSKESLMSIVDNEAVILGIQSGKYIGLNEIGTEVWNRLSEPIRVSELIREFVDIYDEQEALIREHILDFLSSLADKSLLQTLDDPKP